MATDILHFGAISVRVVGNGNYRPSLLGFDDIESQILVPLVLSSTNRKELFRLSNFNSQRGKLKLETTAINETFKVNNITIFVRPIYSNYPA